MAPRRRLNIVLNEKRGRAPKRRIGREQGDCSDAECDQRNRTDTHDQNQHRDGIVIKPMTALHSHDALYLRNNGAARCFCLALARLMGFYPLISRAAECAGSKLPQNSGPTGAVSGGLRAETIRREALLRFTVKNLSP